MSNSRDWVRAAWLGALSSISVAACQIDKLDGPTDSSDGSGGKSVDPVPGPSSGGSNGHSGGHAGGQDSAEAGATGMAGSPDMGELGGATGSGGSANLEDPDLMPGGVPWEAWPTVDAAQPDSCTVSRFNGGDLESEPVQLGQEVWEYDDAQRILTRKRLATATVEAWEGYMRFDEQGRREMVCHAKEHFSCMDWVRDSSGNAKSYHYFGVVAGPLDIRALDPAHPPTQVAPADGGGESENHTLSYDDSGLLKTASYSYPGQGATATFSRDDQGRCTDVTWSMESITETDHWTFSGGKLVKRVVTNVDDPSDIRAVINYSYDSKGILATTVVDGRIDFPDAFGSPVVTRDGAADYVIRSREEADGARWLEYLDFTKNSRTTKVERDGVPTAVSRIRWHFSQACAALELPQHTSQDCEFERPLPMMPVGWSNPLMTPLPVDGSTPFPD